MPAIPDIWEEYIGGLLCKASPKKV
jgi:hypothetical protein